MLGYVILSVDEMVIVSRRGIEEWRMDSDKRLFMWLVGKCFKNSVGLFLMMVMFFFIRGFFYIGFW